MPTIEIVGVYPIEAEEPVHLVEVWFKNLSEMMDLCSVTQEWPGKDRQEWQVPYLEQILNAAGDSIIVNWMETDKMLGVWNGDVRMVFFFHYLSFDRPLITPFAEVEVPAEQQLPSRLNMITYFPP